MIDFRLMTFLQLCQTMNYTKTAEQLHLTQPTITQHIQYLEKQYGKKLFHYEGKKLSLTKEGALLQQYAATLQADSRQMQEKLMHCDEAWQSIRFAATLTIGEYVMPFILAPYLQQNPRTTLRMLVDNTKTILQLLQAGEIDFAFVEGNFPKREYGHRLFSEESYVAVCSPSHPLSTGVYEIEDLLSQRLLLREKGSGTRAVLENALKERTLAIDDFSSFAEIGNLNVVKQLVAQNFGIAFFYEAAVREELQHGVLKKIQIKDWQMSHEFNFIYLKDTMFAEEYLSFYDYSKKIWRKRK